MSKTESNIQNIQKSNSYLSGKSQPGGESHGGANAIIVLIIVVLILIFFFWHFIDFSRPIEQGSISQNALPQTSGISPPIPVQVIPQYQKYYTWAGTIGARYYAVWGPLTFDQPEISVSGQEFPAPPSTIYGHVLEATGQGVNLYIFDEAGYNSWTGTGNTPGYMQRQVTNSTYAYTIGHGRYYIVVDNSRGSADTFVGFTGTIAYTRPLKSGEDAQTGVSGVPDYRWSIMSEKLTLFEYIMNIILQGPSTVMNPPSIIPGR